MGKKIKISNIAQKDIENVLIYLTSELVNDIAALNFLSELEKKLDNILQFPKSYPLIDNKYVLIDKVRKCIFSNYLIFFREQENEILILRVLHSTQDLIRYL